MPNKFQTFLDKVAAVAKNVGKFIVQKALPVAVEAAELAEPVIDLAFPALGPEFNIVVAAVAETEASWAVVGQEAGTGAQKMADVIEAVESKLLPTLTAQGLETAAAQAKIAGYAQAVVTILNTFPVPAKPATPPATATPTTSQV